MVLDGGGRGLELVCGGGGGIRVGVIQRNAGALVGVVCVGTV